MGRNGGAAVSLLLSNLFAALSRRRQARAHARRGNGLYQRGDFEGAVAEYQEALRLAPDLPLTLFNLGLALYKTGRKGEARKSWEEALALSEGRNDYLAEQTRIMLRQFG